MPFVNVADYTAKLDSVMFEILY